MSSLATKRSLTYWTIFVSFLFIGGPIMTADVVGTKTVHDILDGSSLLLAIAATVFAYRAYRKTNATALAIVSMTFAGLIGLDVFHDVADTGMLHAFLASSVENFMPWSWHATRMQLAIGMLAFALHSSRESFGSPATVGRKNFPTPKVFAVLMLVAMVGTIFGLLTIELPSIYYGAATLIRVPDVISGTIILAAIILLARKGNWRNDSYGHWILVSLVLALCGQYFCMAFSQAYLDSSFLFGHLMKVISYATLVYGLGAPHHVTAHNEQANENKPKGLSLSVKIGLLCGFIGVICVVPVAIKSSSNLHEIAATNGIEKLSVAARNSGRDLDNLRRRVDADLGYLAGTKVIASLNRAEEYGGVDDVTSRTTEELIVAVSRLAQNLLVSDSHYLTLAYIDAQTGKPIVRVEQRAGEGLAAINRPALQASESAIARQLFEGARKVTATRSPIIMLTDASPEAGRVLVEGTALALYSSETDAVTGILVAHSDISSAMAATPLTNVDTKLYVVNSEGQFLVHPNPEKSMLDSGYTLADEFPGKEFSVKDDAEQGFVFEALDGAERLVGYSRETAASGESLLYIYSGSREQMEMTATVIGNELQQIAQINLFLAIAIGWFFARLFTKPVQKVSAAAVEFGRSGTVMNLDMKNRRDEIAMLANSLTDMMNEVAAQREKMLLLSSAVESSIDSTIITAIHGEIEYVNPTYEQYAGINASDMLHKNIMELTEFKQNRHILNQEPSEKGSEKVWTGEMRVRRADGRMHDELVTISPIRDTEGEMINMSMVIEDITARKEMERAIELKAAELQRSNRDLEQFAYVASHDLKSPLRAIEVLVGWLKDDLEDYQEGDVQENLDLLRKRTTRLSRLLDDLLAYSRAGRKIGDIKDIDTKEFVEDIAMLIGPPEGFTIEVADDMPSISTYHAPLETVFRNLMGNAIKHSPVPEEGRIRIYSEDKGDRVQFSVEDNGAGIDHQYAEKVFKMFQTLQARDEKEGSGMGLAIVQRIIDWNGGKIWFEDGPEGKGTVFHFTWSKKPRESAELPMVNAGAVDDAMSQTQILRAQAEADARAEAKAREADEAEEAAAQAAVAEAESSSAEPDNEKAEPAASMDKLIT